jgi:hypothetical protein
MIVICFSLIIFLIEIFNLSDLVLILLIVFFILFEIIYKIVNFLKFHHLLTFYLLDLIFIILIIIYFI